MEKTLSIQSIIFNVQDVSLSGMRRESKMKRKCPLCGSEKIEVNFRKIVKGYELEKFILCRCKECGLRWIEES